MPYVKSMSVSGFRGFGEPQTLQFAIPQDKVLGSGLTILVGPNNGGKSTLLEALHYASRGADFQLVRPARNANTNYEATFALQWSDGVTFKLASNPDDPHIIKAPEGAHSEQKKTARCIYYVGARRAIPDTVSNPAAARSEYEKSVQLSAQRDVQGNQDGRLRALCRDRARVIPLLKDLIGTELRLSTEGNQLYVNLEGNEHTPSGLGAGIQSAIRILEALYDAPEGSTIVIDEPELSLHPYLQAKVLAWFEQAAAERQIVYSTHSPFLISWTAVQTGAELARVFREPRGSCKIAQLQRPTVETLSGLLTDLNNPHVLGLDANAVFFLADRIILVEGQDDVIRYRLMADQLKLELPGSFYGWGVGGAHKMEIICSLLRDLGYGRVVGVLDGDKQNVLTKLREAFPAYQFMCIPTRDIKDKEDRKTGEIVKGLCDSAGRLHEDQIPVVRQLFQNISDHLDGRGPAVEAVTTFRDAVSELTRS